MIQKDPWRERKAFRIGRFSCPVFRSDPTQKRDIALELLLNSQKVPFGGENLFEFLALQGAVQRKGIAVAVNEEVVAKEDWPRFALKPGDQILIIQPTQGG